MFSHFFINIFMILFVVQSSVLPEISDVRHSAASPVCLTWVQDRAELGTVVYLGSFGGETFTLLPTEFPVVFGTGVGPNDINTKFTFSMLCLK